MRVVHATQTSPPAVDTPPRASPSSFRMSAHMFSFLGNFFLAAPHTTIIIPTYNESSTISATIHAIKQHRRAAVQIIVCDGYSQDDTAVKARRAGAKVLRVRGGRAQQLNKGALLARAHNLLFLHADTKVPPAFDSEIARVLAQRDVIAGAFRLHIDSKRFGIQCVQTVANWRSRLFQRPYGDQGLFITKQNFRHVGGYPPMPFLEDYEMVRRLSRSGRVSTANSSVITNARRWETLGVAQTTVMNQLVLAAYHLGMKPSTLAKWYRGAVRNGVKSTQKRATAPAP